MARAKDGAVNLRQVLEDMGAKGTVRIISEQDIRALARDKATLEDYKGGVTGAGMTMGGSLLGGVSALAHGNFRDAGLQALRFLKPFTDYDYPLIGNPYQKATAATAPKGKGGSFPGAFFLDPRIAMVMGLQHQLESLTEDEKDLQRPKPHVTTSRENPMLTDWEQIGAAVRSPGFTMTKVEQGQERTNSLLLDVKSQIGAITAALKSIQGGA
jgi:hypothetical protein